MSNVQKPILQHFGAMTSTVMEDEEKKLSTGCTDVASVQRTGLTGGFGSVVSEGQRLVQSRE